MVEKSVQDILKELKSKKITKNAIKKEVDRVVARDFVGEKVYDYITKMKEEYKDDICVILQCDELQKWVENYLNYDEILQKRRLEKEKLEKALKGGNLEKLGEHFSFDENEKVIDNEQSGFSRFSEYFTYEKK